MRRRVRERLLAERVAAGHWVGELASSALATATASFALADGGEAADRPLAERGLAWLAACQNPDGGWGDTALSHSNISTTALCWAALSAGSAPQERALARRAETWLRQHAGGLDPVAIAGAIDARYGRDRTFSAPILALCAASGRLGAGPEAWRWVMPLPFELAAVPQPCYRWLRLPVVSYALPALIAIGLARFRNLPPRNPVTRLLRAAASARALRVLEAIQPPSGGYLEAVPLTSFVAMSLSAAGQRDHPVAQRARAFLRFQQRPDGSWPIDTNLATWVTTLAVDALAGGPAGIPEEARAPLRAWLLGQQHRRRHPYTGAAPGGWAWTHLPGAVPDADDTAGAIVALRHLGSSNQDVRQAAAAGVAWLLDLQNTDGGFPTFCRGWGHLPFDRSGSDLTAHAVRAIHLWRKDLPPALAARAARTLDRGIAFLAATQRRDGAWVPLWFGNQNEPQEENPLYGTARVLSGLRQVQDPQAQALCARGRHFLAAAQNEDGGWGGAAGLPSTVEETALAVAVLAAPPSPESAAVRRGAEWLIARTDAGRSFPPAPIGLYFAKLWYFEKLYPLIFTEAAVAQIESAAGV